jgi:hypothetical protein
MKFETILKYEVEQRKIVRDHHNNDLVAEVNYFIKNDKLLGVLTDYEWLDHIAAIVNQRKMQWGTTDCTTGLTYKR